MERKVDIEFDQLMKTIKKLPKAKIALLKAELAGNSLSKIRENISNFQQLLLSGPVLNDAQYADFRETRSRLNKWRA